MSAEASGSTGAREGATAFRDVMCGVPGPAMEGRTLRLAGWVHGRRDLGGLVFIDLRDRTGRMQLSFGPDWSDETVLEAAAELRPEDVVQVAGEVALRPEDAINREHPTGEVELHVTRLRRLAAAEDLPVLVAIPPEEALPAEELRLRHRTLDLRRPEMIRNLRVRHRAVAAARASLDAGGFVEVETPLLTRRTPEGARDYLVPSRIHRGAFYALPQSPQIYKQLLMTAGFDRYYQVARCLRDEDLRADRQPEFTQIDVEMSFVDEEDVFGVCERMLARMWKEAAGVEPELPLPRMTHAETLERYGTDKPDLRIPWELQDLTETLTGIGFRIFDGAADAGGRVRGVVAKGGASLSRSDLDALDEAASRRGAKGVLWLKRATGGGDGAGGTGGGDGTTPAGWSGPPARSLDEERASILAQRHGVEPGDLLLIVAGPDSETAAPLDAVRRRAAERLDAVERGSHRWLWVTDYPLFESDPETGRPVPTHHPFTLPATREAAAIRDRPLETMAHAYDVVYNGTEVCSGSLRCHIPDLQRAIFDVLGFDRAEVEERFGFLLEAFRYGVPPHGGYALGLDRTVAMMLGAPSIREVIAFPKTTAARGLLEGAPAPIPAEELEELGIRIENPGGT